MIDAIDGLMRRLPVLSRETNPSLAAVLGFLLGGIGLGIYFRSVIDFFVPLAIAIALSLMLGGDIGWIGGALCATFWGYFRSTESNERRGHAIELGPAPAP